MADDLHLGTKELLHRVLDDAARRGDIIPSACDDAFIILRDKIEVDRTNNKLMLLGDSLDEGVKKAIASRPHWQPQTDNSAVQAAESLRDEVLSGSVTAHGRMLRQDPAGYQKLVQETGARPGKSAATPPANAKDRKAAEDRRSNPFSAEGWNVTKQAGLVKSLGLAKANEIAAAVGARVGQTRPARAA
jgi:hypothetical protein